jgi:putative transcriptional regulator
MTNESNFHPSTDMLRKFSAGDLSAGMMVALSAHLELCEVCKRRSEEIELELAGDWRPAQTGADSSELSDLISGIVSQPQVTELREKKPILEQIHMLEHSVSLPKVLAKATSQGLVWKQAGGGINRATVDLDEETQCEFIYMKPGSKTPVHKHQGTEATLVLGGSFSDELGEYRRSDFIFRTSSDMHQPRSEEGCLCFSVLDSPLTFTKGLARLLNPINKLRFQRAVGNRAS